MMNVRFQQLSMVCGSVMVVRAVLKESGLEI